MYLLESPHRIEGRKGIHIFFPFAPEPYAMINNQWLELPIPRTNFLGLKDVQATEVGLYTTLDTRIIYMVSKVVNQGLVVQN